VTHHAILSPQSPSARVATLADVIAVHGREHEQSRCIVFTSTKRECDELCGAAALAPLGAQALHGDISQAQRDLTLKKFREGAFSVLVATDVAARGIDVPGIDIVVQYRLPDDPGSYVHRSGRTGRAGREGASVLLYSEKEGRDLQNLERRANVKFERGGPPSLEKVMEAAAALVPGRLDSVDEQVLPFFADAAEQLLAQPGPEAARQVAAALALIAGKREISQRSLLTGEEGTKTLQLVSTDGGTAGGARPPCPLPSVAPPPPCPLPLASSGAAAAPARTLQAHASTHPAGTPSRHAQHTQHTHPARQLPRSFSGPFSGPDDAARQPAPSTIRQCAGGGRRDGRR